MWACVAASLTDPAVSVSGLLQTVGSPETRQPVLLLYAAMIAIASVCAAVVCYFLLRNTKLVQSSGDEDQGTSSMTMIDPGSTARAPLMQRIKNILSAAARRVAEDCRRARHHRLALRQLHYTGCRLCDAVQLHRQPARRDDIGRHA